MYWCLVNEVTMDLTGMGSLSVSDGVRDHLWPLRFLEERIEELEFEERNRDLDRFWASHSSHTIGLHIQNLR